MKQKEYNELENKILKDNDSESRLKLNNELKKVSIISLSIFGFIFLFSLFFISKITKLSIIPPMWFYIIFFITVIFNVITLLLTTLFKDSLNSTSFLLYYRVYDLLGFVLKIAVIIMAVVMFIVTPTTVVGNSMNYTLDSGDKVLVWHIGYVPKKNDVVVIDITETKYGQDDSLFIKRVVATAGDEVSYKDNIFYVNGNPIEEDMTLAEYINCINLYNDEENTNTTFKVPKGYSIVLGDHRTSSIDSRRIGLVSNKDLLGKAIFVFFSKNNFGPLKKNLSYE